MPIPSYRLISLEQPVGHGASNARYVGVAGVGKLHSPQSYTVANEWVAAEIAKLFRLPIPPCFMTGTENGDRYFVSMNFNLAAEALPPVDAGAVAKNHPVLSARLIAFDALVANSDRHTGNLAQHPVTKQLMVFDHSHAVLGPGGVGTGQAYLQAVEDDLGILGHLPNGGPRGSRHCLVDQMTSPSNLRDAAAYVAALNKALLTEIAREVRDFDIPAGEADFLVTFLRGRCDKLPGMMERSLPQFPKVGQEDLL